MCALGCDEMRSSSSSCSCSVLVLLLLLLLLLLSAPHSPAPPPAPPAPAPCSSCSCSQEDVWTSTAWYTELTWAHCSMCTFQSIPHLRLWPKNCTQYNVRTALNVNKCIAYLHIAQRTHCTLHTNFYNAQCWMWRINCPLQIANSTLHIAYYTWLHIWYCRWLHYVQWAQC